MKADFTPSKNEYKDLGQFRFWCQKVLPLVYDDSLSYYELLCKVVNYLNETISNVGLMGEDISLLHTAYTELQGYVNTYFDNLDVQIEINNKLDGMSKDGSLSALIQPLFDVYKDTIDNVVQTQNEMLANMRSIVNGQNEAINVVEARMDTVTNLPSGSTSGDAELADIRVGADGVMYQNAGTAVRTQYEKSMHEADIARMLLRGNVASIGDVLDYTLEQGLLKNGVYISNANEQYGFTSYIDISALKQVFINCYMHYENDLVAFYAEDKSFISSIKSKGGSEYTYLKDVVDIPQNAYYMRVASIYPAKNLIVRKGVFVIKSGDYIDKSIKYQALNDTLSNMLMPNNVNNIELTYNEYANYYLNYIGKFVAYEGIHVSDKFEVTPGENLCVSGYSWSGANLYAFYDKEDNVLSVYPGQTDGDTKVYENIIVIPPLNARYMRICDNPRTTDIITSVSRIVDFKVKASSVLDWSHIKWACVGDSLTERNSRTTIGYYDYIKNKTNISVVNMGVSGSGYGRQSELNRAFYQRILNVPLDVNVVTIFGSGNDLSSGLPLGEITDTDVTTLCGCINKTIDNLYSKLPTVQLGIISPTPWEGSMPSDNGSMLRYSDKLKEICEYRGIPFLDLFRCSGLRPNDANFRTLAYSKDNGAGVHPDETGHKMIASQIGNFLSSLIGMF